MVWVFGNSHERVAIKDLNDVIYFRQKKQFSDQEFESSKDLQREIQKGRIIKLEHLPEIKGSIPDSDNLRASVQQTIDLAGIRRVITEVISENKITGMDIQGLVTSFIPIIAETVRQEVLRVSEGLDLRSSPGLSPSMTSTFTGPEYVSEVKVENFKSNIKIEGQQLEGSGVSDSLNALRNLGKSK